MLRTAFVLMVGSLREIGFVRCLKSESLCLLSVSDFAFASMHTPRLAVPN